MPFKKRFISALIASACLLLAATPALAEPKPCIWGWWPSHWKNQDFIPYLESGTDPHNTQWKDSQWIPEHWAQQRPGGGPDVIGGLYRANILRGQYMKRGVPVLEVGPGFYALGGEDKRRVAAMVDHVYGITTAHLNGMYMIYDWRTKRAVGSYTAYGLQIQ